MTSSHRPALGRGLSALIPQTPQAQGTVDMVDIDLVVPNPQQPRTRFDEDALQELAESIVEHGVLQPLVVTRLPSDLGPPTYQLIAGERRLQAARRAGLTHVPVVIKDATDAQLLEIALVENIQRMDLNPIEEAAAFRRLADEFGMTQEQIAQRVGRSRAAVANTVRLLSLEPDIRASLASGQISEGHARALLAIEGSALRLDAWRRIVADALTVRQAEEVAKALKVSSGLPSKRDRRSRRRVDPQTRAIEDRLRSVLGARVSLVRGRTGGRIIITYHSDEELDGILLRMHGSAE
jgi:ParB family chromosome partitioning protein